MSLNLVITMMDRDRRESMEAIFKEAGLPMSLTMLGRGTATQEHLTLNGLKATEKAIISTVADSEKTHHVMLAAKRKLFIDIPGNGIMLSIPIKSVGGGKTLAYLTENQSFGGKPETTFAHELIYVILNEGCSDDVMDAARAAGATGGTLLAAKGAGLMAAEKFLGISLADEKSVLLIVARAEIKADIMKSIIEKAGPGTPSGAICFSLPVSHVAGLRRIEAEE